MKNEEISITQGDSADQMFFGKVGNAMTRVKSAIAAARDHLFATQHEDGYWCGELEADTTLESDYILLHSLFGTGTPQRFEKGKHSGALQAGGGATSGRHCAFAQRGRLR